jgi:hypothetical protein
VFFFLFFIKELDTPLYKGFEIKSKKLSVSFKYPQAEYVNITFRLQELRTESEFLDYDRVEIYHEKKEDLKDGSIEFKKELSSSDGNLYRIKGEINKIKFNKADFAFDKEFKIEKFPGMNFLKC